jgi:transcription antitermination factor NusG
MPWMIAIAESKEAARVALAAKRALAKDSRRRLKTLVERLDEEHGIESYFPLTMDHVKKRGRSETRIRNYLGQYFFVKLKRNWFDKRNIPTYIDERGKHVLPYFFLKLSSDDWLKEVYHERGILDVCSTRDAGPLLMSDEELRFKVKSHEVDGFIPDERKRKRGEKMRVTEGPLKGRVGIFEADLRRGKAAALLIDGKRVVLPEGNFDPIDTSSHRTSMGAIPSGY